jgi:hemoglobin
MLPFTINTLPGGPPRVSMTTPLTPYQLLGGEVVLRQLVQRFYTIMDTDPVAAGIRSLHAPDLTEARDKLFLFLSGWLGGPSLYIERYGHPRLRARHMPFPIGERERDEWLYCMFKAMDEIPMDTHLYEHLQQSFWNTADFMRNQADNSGT